MRPKHMNVQNGSRVFKTTLVDRSHILLSVSLIGVRQYATLFNPMLSSVGGNPQNYSRSFHGHGTRAL